MKSVRQLETKWDRLTKDQIIDLQGRKLRHYLNEIVLPFSSYYRDLFEKHGIDPASIQGVSDLSRLPFMSKADIGNTPEHPDRNRELAIIPDKKVFARRPSVIAQALFRGSAATQRALDKEYRPVFMTSTTGRSADPVPFLYTRHDIRNMALAGKRVMEVCGATQDQRMINMFPYAPHLAFWQTHYAGLDFGVFVLSTGGGKVMGTAGNLRAINKVNPDVIIGIPTFIYHVLSQAAEEGVLCKNLKKIVLGGEKVEIGMRKKLAQLAYKLGAKNVDVLATYGFTEAKMAFAECPYPEGEEPSGYHLCPDLGIVEVVDPATGSVVEEGCPGEIVYTSLDARGTTVLRYRTGDMIERGLVYGTCPHCGRMAPRLVGRISRCSEVREMSLNKVKGTLVDFNQLEHVMENVDHVGAWQLELRKIDDDPNELDELILHVEKADRIADGELTSLLKRQFQSNTEICPNRIEFHNAREIRQIQGVGVQLKEQKIVDHRPNGGPAPPRIFGHRNGEGLLKKLFGGFFQAKESSDTEK